ncbi:hypothetical protein AIOL_001121 [Candidatus Rhodobacter oscarellae]|uniref:Rhamnosyl transferase n=1 Tax=Candidatus Rhodobacter oscarellae TaxID=1675527 RepID=A0A0J9E306_9RHOB|nr:glycosyltransferase [Candidatus Rhodobacter lobularis]KMW56169.1 hypothetical protein AIOL_001121 [Candidatus Rhodobacter lobularis]
MARLQILGLLRFSYPSIYNQKGLDDFAARRAELYEPRRLERRLVWFEHVVIPCLRGQTDPDFQCLLLVGDQLPEPFRGRLVALADQVPQIKVCFEEEGQNHRQAVKALMDGHSDPGADFVAEFQLDDDDAVHREFIAETRAHLPLMMGLLVDTNWASLDFSRGLVLRMDASGHELRMAQCRLWTPGLVTFRPPSKSTVLRRIDHLKLWQHMPVISVPKRNMFLRGAHEDNVSNFSNRWDRHCTDDEIGNPAQLLQRAFGIDLAAMQRARSAAG